MTGLPRPRGDGRGLRLEERMNDLRQAAESLDFALSFHNRTPSGEPKPCLPGCIACEARRYFALAAADPAPAPVAPEGLVARLADLIHSGATGSAIHEDQWAMSAVSFPAERCAPCKRAAAELAESFAPAAQDSPDPLREALEGMAHQFGYWSNGALSTGGLSALEVAFEVLGWDDPHPVPERCCQWPGGCTEDQGCGTPVGDDDPDYGGKRYVWTCWDHSPEGLRRSRAAIEGQSPKEPTDAR